MATEVSENAPPHWGMKDQDTSFYSEAACRTTEAGRAVDFFSLRTRDISAAKTVCSSCPVRERCLEYAHNNKLVMFVFGGERMPGRNWA